MIKGINKINNFGVFSNYAKPESIEQFAEKNIIYGWNYSGKTTISRIFHCVEFRQLHKDFKQASISIEFDNGVIISETNLNSSPYEVRVFNSDFVDENLSWGGESFNPIFLVMNL